MDIILDVSDLNLKVHYDDKDFNIITDASISLKKGEVAGIIGESGCGKSVFWKSILGMLDESKWAIEGRVRFDGNEINYTDESALRSIRGKDISVILQDPMSSFDPIFTIEDHFRETAAAHAVMSKDEVRKKAVELLTRLYIDEPENVLTMYPFQCSGGMLQRIMIAIAMMFNPRLLIADEPTTSVDMTIQQEILSMLKELNTDSKTGILFVSHDLKAVESIAHNIYVMYAGYIVESLPASMLSKEGALHPYTIGLLGSRPDFTKNRLVTIEGSPIRPDERKGGCPFFKRCERKKPDCQNYNMHLTEVQPGHTVRCFLYGGR